MLSCLDPALLGETTVEDWVNVIRDAPAPWAELEFENIILTLHSDFIRGLDRPDEVASMWDDIMRGIADLAAKPAKFPRKERFVADVQISHGQFTFKCTTQGWVGDFSQSGHFKRLHGELKGLKCVDKMCLI